MSDENEQQEEEKEDPALKALLKRSLSVPAPEPTKKDEKQLLEGVQRKLRKRSKGKFYSDGWSTTQSRINYILVAMIMLLTIAIVYFALGPTGISK
ncbi:MAG TPA: hypothetical protein VIF62_25740 [Labilithrix sp.]